VVKVGKKNGASRGGTKFGETVGETPVQKKPNPRTGGGFPPTTGKEVKSFFAHTKKKVFGGSVTLQSVGRRQATKMEWDNTQPVERTGVKTEESKDVLEGEGGGVCGP